MPMSRSFTAAVHREEDWYVAQCLEVDVASQGQTIDEARARRRVSPALSDLPVRKVTRALESIGFAYERTKGSHAIYRRY